MTDEQIQQNAETAYPGFEDLQAVYIEGAHSLDEEIEELKEEIESLQEQYNTCFDGFTKRGTKLGELMKENVKLRNTWISVEDRLPEKAIGKSERSEYVLCRHKDGNYYVAYWHVGFEYWYSIPYKIDKSNITHWMPIPELKKGE